MHAHIGIGAVDARALAERVAKPVAHRVLDAQRRELEALQRALLRRDVDAQRALDAEVARPVDGLRRGVEILLVAVVELADAPEDARGDAATRGWRDSRHPSRRRRRRRRAPRWRSICRARRARAPAAAPARAGSSRRKLQNGLKTTRSTAAKRTSVGNFVEPAEPDVALGVALGGEIAQQQAAPQVVGDEQRGQRHLRVQPARRRRGTSRATARGRRRS